MSGEQPIPDHPDETSSGATLDANRTVSQVVTPAEDVGRRIGAFDLLEEIGRGGMGIVYKAWQRGLNRVVALKMIRGRAHCDPNAVSRFRREAEAVARLHHPNIVHVHEVGEQGGQPYLVMEYVPGPSLARRLSAGPLSARDTAALLETLARAVEHAHRSGVVHRDLKPSNVLLTPSPAAESSGTEARRDDLADSIPKIVDFGLAKFEATDSDPTLSGAVLGTPNYMAPEQARGDAKRVGPGADVWALGAILYECLTGRPPFQAGTTLDILWLIAERDPVPPTSLNPRVPGDLETVCLKCLEKGVEQRYPSAQELADDLGRFGRDEPIRARPPSAVYQLRKFVRRNKGLFAGVAAVLVALILGLVGTGIGLVRALAAKDRAEVAEGNARRLLAESYAQSARLATRRGAWRDALAQFDRALDAGHPDQADLRLQKVRVWCAVHDIPKAVAEIETLARRPDLGSLAGPVMLWQADLDLARSKGEDAALALVRRALDAGLPAAEQEYALGLLASTSPEAIRHFEKAVDADPFYQRANGMLGLTLILSGRFTQAREQIAVARLLFPEDPTFAVLLALTLVWDGDVKAAHAVLERARDILGDRPMTAAKKMLDVMQQFRGLESTFNEDPSGVPKALMTRFLPACLSLGAEVQSLKQVDGGQGLVLPVPPVLLTAIRQPLPALISSLLRKDAKSLRDLERAYEVHPDAFLAFARGVVAADSNHFAEAERAFLQAADSYSMVPVQRISLFAAVKCELERAVRDPATRGETIAAAMRNARKLLERGPLPPWQAQLIADVAIGTGDFDLARRVLADWERQAPKDVSLWRERLEVEFQSNSFAKAIQAADKILALKPGDADAKQARRRAVERLQKQAKDYAPPTDPPK
jgi:tetratricopeptide (TPR) repeat protein